MIILYFDIFLICISSLLISSLPPFLPSSLPPFLPPLPPPPPPPPQRAAYIFNNHWYQNILVYICISMLNVSLYIEWILLSSYTESHVGLRGREGGREGVGEDGGAVSSRDWWVVSPYNNNYYYHYYYFYYCFVLEIFFWPLFLFTVNLLLIDNGQVVSLNVYNDN